MHVWGIWNKSVLFSQFCAEPKAALKSHRLTKPLKPSPDLHSPLTTVLFLFSLTVNLFCNFYYEKI